MSATTISVSPAPTKRVPGPHWQDKTGTRFVNPWESWWDPGALDIFKVMMGFFASSFYESGDRAADEQFLRKFNSLSSADDARDMPIADELIPRMKPTWGDDQPGNEGKIKVTWMGHAAALVEMPLGLPGHDKAGGVTGAEDAASVLSEPKVKVGKKERGVSILFDPAFSKKCSPTQWFGSTRYQPVPATIPELPELDAIVISHNHYDHQDNNTLIEIYTHYSSRPPLLFIPLNNTHNLPSNIPRDKIVEMDWWEEREVNVVGKGRVKFTCSFDKFRSLWASWAVKHVPSDAAAASTAPSLWFGGDTGYLKATSESLAFDANPEGSTPHCPAFKEIGERVGPFSIALIPIGAYGPRWFLSNVHASPAESVRIFKDVKAKQAIGIHWGTWHMAYEPVAEPPRILAEVRGPMGVTEEQFGVMKIGETRAYA